MSEEMDGGDLGLFEQAKKDARDGLKGKSLRVLVEHQAEYAARKEDLENQLKVVNGFYDVIRMELVPEAMEEAGIENIRYDDIGRVSITADVMVSVKGGQKDGLFAWFKGHKLGDLIQPAVNSSTLKAFVKRRIKEGKEYPIDMLNVTPIQRASITKG